jgi:hypothetical protein
MVTGAKRKGTPRLRERKTHRARTIGKSPIGSPTVPKTIDGISSVQ